MKECPFRVEGQAIMYENTIVGIITEPRMLAMCASLVRDAWGIGYLDRDAEERSGLKPISVTGTIGGSK